MANVHDKRAEKTTGHRRQTLGSDGIQSEKLCIFRTYHLDCNPPALGVTIATVICGYRNCYLWFTLHPVTSKSLYSLY
jgi:hypothetical protein